MRPSMRAPTVPGEVGCLGDHKRSMGLIRQPIDFMGFGDSTEESLALR